MYNSIYPLQIKPYVPPSVVKKQVTTKEEDQESSRSSQSELNRDENRPYHRNATDPHGDRDTFSHQEFPNGQRTTIDYSNSKVNIAQILTDFKNTAIAIGSPPTLIQEVEQYLSLAETQSLKPDPNKKIIQSNLRTASTLLDDFISKTLNKKSKVVENWIDALFLQQVDYKSDPNTINSDFLVKLPDKETGDMKPISQTLSEKAQAQAERQSAMQSSLNTEPVAQESATKSNVYIPANEDVKTAFLNGKKYALINEDDKAIQAFLTALETAQLVGDTKAEGMVCFELGLIFDKNDNLDDALKYYHQAYTTSDDNNIKAKACYLTAQIYDDVVYFEPAVEHYFAAISYAGEAENFNAQTKALANIGDMYAERYEKDKTYEFYSLAKNIALESKNNKTMGAIWARCGDSMVLLNETISALQDYKMSAQFYEETDSSSKMAQNYEKASQIMLQLGNTQKAEKLLKKAELLRNNAV